MLARQLFRYASKRNHVQSGSKFMSRTMSAVVFDKFGLPTDVCKLRDSNQGPLNPANIDVSVKVAAVLPEDIRSIMGLSFSSRIGVAGSTAVGEVASVGNSVKSIAPKDNVFIVGNGLWSDRVQVAESTSFRIPALPSSKSAHLASVLSAWAILNNYTTLKSGDVVVQAVSEGAVAQAITQIGKAKGYQVVSATAAQLADAAFVDKLKAQGPIKLAVCGQSGPIQRNLVKLLSDGGASVMYHGSVERSLESDGVSIPVTAAIFQDASVHGFNLATWVTSSPERVREGLSVVAELLKTDAVKINGKSFPQAEFINAVKSVGLTGAAAAISF